MKLTQILEGLKVKETVNDLNLDITNIHSDSRKIKENGLFIAIDGYLQKGIDYLPDAIKNGAIAAIIEENVDTSTLPQTITYIKAGNTRIALAVTSCNLYDNPSRKFKLIGVTGTKGKTTTTFMIKKVLEKQGIKTEKVLKYKNT